MRLVPKAGVILPTVFRRETLRIWLAVMDVYEEAGETAVVLTAALEDLHSDTSLHERQRAFDFRPPTKVSPQKALAAIKAKLGTGYDCLFEGNHLHVEWDPK